MKYERYASFGCWDLGIIKLGFVAKTPRLGIQSSYFGQIRGLNISFLPCRAQLFIDWTVSGGYIYIPPVHTLAKKIALPSLRIHLSYL